VDVQRWLLMDNHPPAPAHANLARPDVVQEGHVTAIAASIFPDLHAKQEETMTCAA